MLKRFDIVVWNYERIDAFFSNFHKIENFDSAKDRITIVSCSPSDVETAAVTDFTARTHIGIRYLVRENRGIDQLARAQYFSGEVGQLEENLSYNWILQMQDHFLDTDSTFSRYGKENGFALKGDIIPDNVTIDLDMLEKVITTNAVDLCFVDRSRPCWFKLLGKVYIAPNGGNFMVKSSSILKEEVQRITKLLSRSCDNTYDWAVFAEFMWGYIFFKEGKRVYDIERARVLTSFDRKDFYVHGGRTNPRFRQVYRKYHLALNLPVPMISCWRLYDNAALLAKRLQQAFSSASRPSNHRR